MTALVTGAGGFIGGHLVKKLLADGERVIAVDIKPLSEWWQVHPFKTRLEPLTDCGDIDVMPEILEDVNDIYHLAENMGGIGFIETHRVACLESVVSSVNLLKMTNPKQHTVFFSSSACAYNTAYQRAIDEPHYEYSLKETDAWPAEPEEGYGLQKLYVEKLLEWHHRERGLPIRVARFHNSYGPMGSYRDGREKAPAAICRKVAIAELTGKMDIDIWGDGSQLRSFMYVDDNIEGIQRIMAASGLFDPINLGSSEMVSVDELVDYVEYIAFGKRVLERNYQLDKPKGVAGRNSDNTRISQCLGWEPTIGLITGLGDTYSWIHAQVARDLADGKIDV
jgi:nucleoside-diphosphate-sugar epimerase